ncbi:hypothetical protein SLITK23_00320 [Streptomyces lividans]|uniref:Transposase n=1 Tax=Streptomyces violaceolatus TaxID=67378 RepID=A0ABN3SP54_9ACTN|nr:predicted protein [Streptomyces lividans TK24]BDE36787.1 hypothetical protein SLITK23_00320 [Streptomyces lividans]GHB87429.1 hypothetical protein GCM10010348_00090 [Streptomyces anthocyanicus]
MLALQPRKRFAKDAVLIMDGTLAPTRGCRLDLAGVAGSGTRIWGVVVGCQLPDARLRSRGGTPIALSPSSASQLHAPDPARVGHKAPSVAAGLLQTTPSRCVVPGRW